MMWRRGLGYLTGLLILCSCSWWEDDVLHVPPTPEFTSADQLDRIALTATDAGDKFVYSWSSSTPVTFFPDPNNKLISYFKIPETSVGANADVTLEVSHKKRKKSSTLTVNVPAFSLIRSYGLGQVSVAEHSNNVNYDWYIDQKTGTYPAVDCGPTSVTMAIKWYNRNFTGTPAAARSLYRPDGGWWFVSDIGAYLVGNNVPNYVISLTSVNDLKGELDKGNIMILCLDMYYVSGESKPEYHINKFYKTAAPEWGHFIVVKGYKEVKLNGVKTLYFEVNDPFSQGVSYADNALKGKDRYYLGADLILAAGKWWKYAIVITKNNVNARMGVDWAVVPDQKGR
ncbi:MAG TPA: C39 family peptidase [Cyclobacteriaceae bacterium]|nr:C39 family peptidase [Cyclobacteriaceae bacterium]